MSLREIRKDRANHLKAAFNLLWEECLKRSEEHAGEKNISYRDMVRVADAIKYEGPKILGLKELPAQIVASLQYAVAAADPNEERSKENWKLAFCSLTGSGGLTLAATCLMQILNPGVWAIVVAFFAGGIPAGPFAPAMVAAGLLVVFASLYAAFQRMTPAERATQVHRIVMTGIDRWAKDGGGDQSSWCIDNANRKKTAEISINEHDSEHIDKVVNILAHGFSFNLTDEDVLALNVLLMQVAAIDGSVTKDEHYFVAKACGGVQYPEMSVSTAVDIISQKDRFKKLEILEWCFSLAMVDGIRMPKEKRYLAWLSEKFGFVYDDLDHLYFVKK